jgi:four helix bundle protein
VSGARHFQDLIVWQLADELRGETFALTATPRFGDDLKLRSQVEDAINSACRNIAEGFGADTHREFARFLRISRRSLNEVQDAFVGARAKKYVADCDLRPARILLRRLYPAMNAFIAYLDRTPNERNDARRPKPEQPPNPPKRTKNLKSPKSTNRD